MCSINSNSFEILLNNHISVVHQFLGNDFNRMLFGSDIHYTFSFKPRMYYKQYYNQILIITNSEEVIKKLEIRIFPIFKTFFYDQFVEKYGYPNSIKVFDNISSVSESQSNDKIFEQNLKLTTIKTREGTIEEMPLMIVWLNVGYQITLLYRRDYNVGDVIFKVVN